jgi:RNA polymerase sigma factor (sigma-70 family)
VFDGSDVDVLLAIRAGDTAAIAELYRRHRASALAFAESLAGRSLGPDLVSEAFVRIIDLVDRGGGPTAAFRSYLFTSIRNLYIDHVRRHGRQTSVADFTALESELAIDDDLEARFEHSLVKRAFGSLPRRWQIALWYTTVEGVPLEEAGRYLGLAPSAVAALSFRAREGLRQAYLAEHLEVAVEQSCEAVWEVLPRYVRGTLGSRMSTSVEAHLQDCARCTAAVDELGTVNTDLRGVLLVALVGPVTAIHVDRVVGVRPAVATSNVPVLLATARSLTRAGVAIGAAVVAVAVVLGWPHHPKARDEVRPPGASPVAPPGHQETQPSKASADVRIGRPSSSRLTTTSPSWYHVGVPIRASRSAAAELTLTVRVTRWTAFHVHRETGYGAWVCSSVGAHRLSCHLPSSAGDRADLGLDVQSARRVAITISVRRGADEATVVRAVVG